MVWYYRFVAPTWLRGTHQIPVVDLGTHTCPPLVYRAGQPPLSRDIGAPPGRISMVVTVHKHGGHPTWLNPLRNDSDPTTTDDLQGANPFRLFCFSIHRACVGGLHQTNRDLLWTSTPKLTASYSIPLEGMCGTPLPALITVKCTYPPPRGHYQTGHTVPRGVKVIQCVFAGLNLGFQSAVQVRVRLDLKPSSRRPGARLPRCSLAS